MSYRDWQTTQAQNAILELVRSWEEYEMFTGIICDALEGVAEEVLREKEERFPQLPAPLGLALPATTVLFD